MSNPLRQIEWRSLIEVAGPFLADAVLEKAFPQGLEKLETPRKQRVRSAYDEWCEAVDDSDPQLVQLHAEWLRLVLEDLLEYDATVLKAKLDFPETIRYQHPQTESPVLPDMVVLAGDKPSMLITTFPPGTKLESPLADQSWLASPLERMTLLCRASEVSLGLVTNGEQWTLVSAPAGETSSTASWFARIWQQEPLTLQAFQSLLGVRRMFGPTNETLEALLLESLQHLDEVTDTLGSQVRRAVEVLVQALDRADLDRDRQLLQDVAPAQLYEAGLTVMMRLVFTLCAEERKLLLLGEPIYDQNYAISTLRARLNEDKEQLGEDVLERRHDAWSRLLAVFRAIYGGIEHETLRLPPLGGSIFDPDKYPFLEGRASGTCWVDTPASPLPIDNRTVLLLLNALQVLEQRTGARLLSYLALDVEQIGHVYEGLLERTVKKVPETTLGLIGAQKAVNPNVLLRELEEAKTTGDDRLLAYLLEQTQRSEAGVKKDLSKPLDEALYHRVLLACSGDITLANRIKPFAALLRSDNWGDPLVYRESAYMVTLGAGRRETGTHYTPRTLTEPIVQHTLEPLCYVGPAEGKTREEWQLKSPAELLKLKVCDMAMGSGAFLVQTCRYLGDRLVESWDAEERAGRSISIEGEVREHPIDSELLPREKDERVLIARRLIASRCLYGVDINPIAVELGKLSLWLVTMMRGRPFSFLNHALKCGNSLLGVSSVQQIENFSLRPGERQVTFATANLFRYVDEASAKRRALEDLPSNDHTQIETKNRLHLEAEAATAKVKAFADCLIAFELRGLNGAVYEDQRAEEAEKVQLLMKRDADASLTSQTPNISQLSSHAREQLRGRRSFHWAIEFPEVFARGGFDGFVGNPPFIKGSFISRFLGNDVRDFLSTVLIGEATGLADYSAFFLVRSVDLLNRAGHVGLIVTNGVRDGDSRRIGIQEPRNRGCTLRNAQPEMPWPGDASVIICPLIFAKGEWAGEVLLSGKVVPRISAQLTDEADLVVYPLNFNAGKSFLGNKILGDGFILQPSTVVQEPGALGEVVLPYINGQELFHFPSPSPVRRAICFWDWDLPTAEARFPLLIEHLRQTVKPIRDKVGRDRRRELWWIYAENTPGLYHAVGLGERFKDHPSNWKAATRNIHRVLAKSKSSDTWAFVFLPARMIFDQSLAVFVFEESAMFATLQSAIHWVWADKLVSGNKGLEARKEGGAPISYTPSTVFGTFPLPNAIHGLEILGSTVYEHRSQLMQTRLEGLTKTYNRFHDRGEQSTDIAKLRALHVEMDQAVAAAYGWSDLDLGHDFHATKQGKRYTISEPARRTVLDRLITLNHQRYEDEVKAGLHDKKAKQPGKGKRLPKNNAVDPQPELFT